MSTERLQKILAHGGVASRRAAEKLIVDGRVRVNGRVVTELGTKADPKKDKVEIDGRRIVAETSVYVLLHKPRGVVSTMSDPEGRPSVKELLAPIEARVYPVGRLDFATSGALLATNDGELADALMHPKRDVPKTYVLKVNGVMQPKDLEHWRRGVKLEDGMTLPADVKLLRHEQGKSWVELTIREGRNQQIRRMGEATGFPVMRLARTAFAGISTEGLRPGQWRYLTREELLALKKAYGVPKQIPHIPADVPQAAPPRPRPRPSSGTGTAGPRYGGGAPVRRGLDVREDWGGGVRRGRSSRGGPPEQTTDPSGGRGGRSRTTGTGGGVQSPGGDDASWRVKGRRGR